jgi:hypothetical protein
LAQQGEVALKEYPEGMTCLMATGEGMKKLHQMAPSPLEELLVALAACFL